MPNWLTSRAAMDGASRPNLVQRRELAAVWARDVLNITDGTLPPHWTVLRSPAPCNSCWNGTSYAVLSTLNGYADTVYHCMEHAASRALHSTSMTCYGCGIHYVDDANMSPPWASNGMIQGVARGTNVNLCNLCAVNNYTSCTECRVRYNVNTQQQCCARVPRCAYCNGRESADFAMVTDVQVLSRYDFNAIETLSHVCESCVRDNIRTCIDCNGTSSRTDAYQVLETDDYVCAACFRGYRPTTQYTWGSCDRHGRAYRVGIDDVECCNLHAAIHSYSYKPRPMFRGDGPMYYGMEIEICTRNTSDTADVAGRGFREHVYLKEDSSIRQGFEMVTHPMSYGYWMESFPWGTFANLVQAGAYEHNSCGIHVHAARDGFSGAAHEFRWLAFFDRNQSDIQKVARRVNSSYARFGQLSTRDKRAIATKAIAPGSHYFQRYSAVNVNNAATYEVRIFATSVHADVIKAAVGFVAASVEYTRELSARAVMKSGGMSWIGFRSWVESRPEYAALVAEMNRVGA
jgi:hypothetical protein